MFATPNLSPNHRWPVCQDHGIRGEGFLIGPLRHWRGRGASVCPTALPAEEQIRRVPQFLQRGQPSVQPDHHGERPALGEGNNCDQSRTYRSSPLLFCLLRQGGVRGDDQEKTLSAFVVIALAEAKLAGISCSDPSVDQHVKRYATPPLSSVDLSLTTFSCGVVWCVCYRRS